MVTQDVLCLLIVNHGDMCEESWLQDSLGESSQQGLLHPTGHVTTPVVVGLTGCKLSLCRILNSLDKLNTHSVRGVLQFKQHTINQKLTQLVFFLSEVRSLWSKAKTVLDSTV